jgi:hypothetical protein
MALELVFQERLCGELYLIRVQMTFVGHHGRVVDLDRELFVIDPKDVIGCRSWRPVNSVCLMGFNELDFGLLSQSSSPSKISTFWRMKVYSIGC